MDILSYELGVKSGGGGGKPNLQEKSVTITENTTTNVTPDAGYDGLSKVNITTNVSGGGGTSILPDGYQGVDYIQSNGTQYIDTGVISKSSLTIEVDVRTLQGSDPNGILYGGGAGWQNRYIQGEFDPSATFAFNTYSTSVGIPAFTLNAPYFNKIRQSQNQIFINDTLVQGFGGGTFTSDYTITLFAGNRANTIVENGSFLIKRTKISENNTLIRDMIACYRKADNVIGMYDIVNDVFYTNQGTGTFEKGADVIYSE